MSGLVDYILYGEQEDAPHGIQMQMAPLKVGDEEEPQESLSEIRSREAAQKELSSVEVPEFVHPGGLEIYKLPEVKTNKKEKRKVNPNLPELPFAICAVANQQTGKGTMMINMLLGPDMYKGVFKKIWLISTTAFKDGQWAFLKIPDDQKTLSYSASFGKKIEDFGYEYKEAHGEFPLQCVIFDDFLSTTEGHYNATRMAISSCATSWRHINVCMFVNAQSFNMLTVIGRQNMTAWIVFKMRSSDGFDRFARENTPIDSRLTPHWFRALYNYCVSGPNDAHSFLYVNTRGDYHYGSDSNNRYYKNFKAIPTQVLESFSSLKPFTIAWMHEQKMVATQTRNQISDLKFHEFDTTKLLGQYEKKKAEYDSGTSEEGVSKRQRSEHAEGSGSSGLPQTGAAAQQLPAAELQR